MFSAELPHTKLTPTTKPRGRCEPCQPNELERNSRILCEPCHRAVQEQREHINDLRSYPREPCQPFFNTMKDKPSHCFRLAKFTRKSGSAGKVHIDRTASRRLSAPNVKLTPILGA